MQLVEELAPAPAPRLQGLDEIVEDRVRRLTDYQNAAWAERYRQVVERVRAADSRATEHDSLSIAVARNLYKLMSYKDEYEVARLYTSGEFQRQLEQQFAGDYELRFNLAPPLFSKRDPHTGHLLKREFGPWMFKAFQWVAKLRFLRGTALDLFGRTAERQRERQDIDDYLALLDELLPALSERNYAVACNLAVLPSRLRGFGHIKDRNREQVTQLRERLLRDFHGDDPAPVAFVNAA